jgi:hypothetical protein
MTVLTLLTKIDNDSQLKQVTKALQLLLNGLEVEITVLSAVMEGWVQMSLSGEDEEIAMNYVIKKVGLCPANFKNVKKFSTLKGYIRDVGKKKITVDVGVFQPKNVPAILSLSHLQAALVGGRKLALKKITELFGFFQGLPVNLKIKDLNEEESRIDAELTSKQVKKYVVWRESMLDRLLILGVAFHEVEATIEHAKLDRDVIEVEHLGLLEHALTCKLGTDAVGLIPKIGRDLEKARFAVFNPKTLRHFLNA